MSSIRRIRLLALVCLCAVVGSVATAQIDADKLQKALESYRVVEDQDEAARGKALQKLGAFQDSGVTRILIRELERAKTSVHQELVLKQMARQSRPRVVGAVADVLVNGRTNTRVRRTAAQCLVVHGNRAIDALRDIIESPPKSIPSGAVAQVRRSALQALAGAKDDRAWRALAVLSMAGSSAERREAITYLDKAPATTHVTRARQDAASSTDAMLAATGTLQIVKAGKGNLRRIVENAYQRIGVGGMNQQVRALFIESMAAVVHKGIYDDLLDVSTSAGGQVSRAIKAAAKTATQDVNFVRYLVEVGMEGSDAARIAAQQWLSAADPKVARGEMTSLRRRLKTLTVQDIELVKTLHPIFKDDPTWIEDLRRVAASSQWQLRTMGLSLLTNAGDRESLALAQRSLTHKEWQVRTAAMQFCGKVRDVSSIPRLIGRLNHETGRLKDDLLECLQSLTGYRFLSTARWQRFWRENSEGFEMPPPRVKKREVTASTKTKGFFNIPVVSDRVAFLIDISGSMQGKVGTNKNRTRLQEAKRQLNIAIDALNAERFFNVIVYGSQVRSLRDRLTKATPPNKKETAEQVNKLRIAGATNIYGALEEAFNDPDVDTVFLLTDGQPSAGRITDQDELADEIARWNLTRKVVIHTVSIGTRSRLMQRLAKESGGTFVFVR